MRRRGPVPFSAITGAELAKMMDRRPLPEELVESHATRAQVVEALWSLPALYRRALERVDADEA